MSKDTVVAIHQPNFFPWLGFFNKIALADVFVILDNVQFPKKGGTWSNRVKILVQDAPAWVTVPIIRSYHGVLPINNIRINETTQWREQLVKTIDLSYRRAPHFAQVFPSLADLVNQRTDRLADYNLQAILSLAEAVGLDTTKIVLGTTLNVEGRGTDLLVSMTKAVGGTAYLSGGGAQAYQEDDKFADAGIELLYQGFQHPTYPQRNDAAFVPGLSIIDSAMNCGFEFTADFLLV